MEQIDTGEGEEMDRTIEAAKHIIVYARVRQEHNSQFDQCQFILIYIALFLGF